MKRLRRILKARRDRRPVSMTAPDLSKSRRAEAAAEVLAAKVSRPPTKTVLIEGKPVEVGPLSERGWLQLQAWLNSRPGRVQLKSGSDRALHEVIHSPEGQCVLLRAALADVVPDVDSRVEAIRDEMSIRTLGDILQACLGLTDGQLA